MNTTMKQSSLNGSQFREDVWTQVIADALDAGEVPPTVQDRLDRSYAALPRIPQEVPAYTRPARRFFRAPIAIAVALVCALFATAAFAASNLISMKSGEGSFFFADKNLPVYDSMAEGARLLSAEVGQVSTIGDTNITLDSISCDRNVANLYFTLTRAGGFDLQEASMYTGSKEATWPRVERFTPWVEYALQDDGGIYEEGRARQLDAYLEGDAIKCMMRITPEQCMGKEVRIDLKASLWMSETPDSTAAFSVGLDLSEVPAPRQIEQQDVIFETVQGVKTLGIKRFTASELATVLVVRNDEAFDPDVSGRPVSEGIPASAIAPYHLMITDNMGNTLVPVSAGDGMGIDLQGSYVNEYARLAPEATSVTITPILYAFDEAAKNQERHFVDVTQPDAKIAINEFGGYNVVKHEIQDGAAFITLRPYGWVPGNGGQVLTIADEPPTLEERYTDSVTGECYVGEHSGLQVLKCDYQTGDVLDMTFFYYATDEELSSLTLYRYYADPVGTFVKDDAAAVTRSFS